MSKFIAFYLPQYYPTKENNEWWGAGFTEWRSVNTAKPLFKGHVQPKVPRDLGYYDLRVSETREAQALLAKEHGIDAFCYWHYWFGNGRRLLDRPFTEVVELGKPDFPFCLGWANHSWYNKAWGGKGKDKLLIEQQYLGEEDNLNHFNAMLKAFKDKRYLRHDGKLVFIIYAPLDNPKISEFIAQWRSLASVNGLNDFFFIGKVSYSKDKQKLLDIGFDAVYTDRYLSIYQNEPQIKKAFRLLKAKLFNTPMVYKYKDAAKYMLTDEERNEDVCPLIVPNWDHSPRSKAAHPIFVDTKPEYFQKLVEQAENIVETKANDIVIVKSWNEWGEGNYLEPDMQYGKGLLEALKRGRRF